MEIVSGTSQQILGQIEAAIQLRQPRKALWAIPAWLRLQRGALPARVQASQFYRRVSAPHLALSTLQGAFRKKSGVSTGLPRLRPESPEAVRFWVEYFIVLTSLGATLYPRQAFDRLPKDLLNPLDQALLLTYCYRDEQALPLYEKIRGVEDEDLRTEERRALVSLGFTYYRLGRYEDSIQTLERYISVSTTAPPELGVRAQALSCIGTCKLKLGDLKGDSRAFDRSWPLSHAGSPSLSTGESETWKGALACLLGDFKGAEMLLDSAWKILFQPGRRPEPWLTTLYWRGHLAWLKSGRTAVPEAWLRLAAYPSPWPGYVRWIQETCPEFPQVFRLNARGAVKMDEGGRCLDLSSDVAEEDGSPGLGLI